MHALVLVTVVFHQIEPATIQRSRFSHELMLLAMHACDSRTAVKPLFSLDPNMACAYDWILEAPGREQSPTAAHCFPRAIISLLRDRAAFVWHFYTTLEIGNAGG